MWDGAECQQYGSFYCLCPTQAPDSADQLCLVRSEAMVMCRRCQYSDQHHHLQPVDLAMVPGRPRSLGHRAVLWSASWQVVPRPATRQLRQLTVQVLILSVSRSHIRQAVSSALHADQLEGCAAQRTAPTAQPTPSANVSWHIAMLATPAAVTPGSDTSAQPTATSNMHHTRYTH
jgi:hypothetical protein